MKIEKEKKLENDILRDVLSLCFTGELVANFRLSLSLSPRRDIARCTSAPYQILIMHVNVGLVAMTTVVHVRRKSICHL